jgi:hypothetical protein
MRSDAGDAVERMTLSVLPTRRIGGMDVVRGLVAWEPAVTPPRELYAAAPVGTFAEPAVAHWLLLSSFTTAMRRGAREIAVAGDVDPALLRGLRYAQAQLAAWYGDAVVEIVGASGSGLRPVTSAASGTAAFLSGGVDSFSLLVRNRRDFPPGHPWAATEAVTIDWMGPRTSDELDELAGRGERPGVVRLRALEQRLAVQLVPIVTNARRLERNDFHYDWMFRAHGAYLAGIAHLLRGRVGRALVASTYDLRTLAPWGSHPLLDQWYGSSELQVLHDSPDLSRLDKLRLLAGDEQVLAALDVCSFWFQRAGAEQPNCGRCEKCLRTLVALQALGVDGASRGFEPSNLLAGVATMTHFQDGYERACWAELPDPLRARGSDTLADVVADLLARAPVENPFGIRPSSEAAAVGGR